MSENEKSSSHYELIQPPNKLAKAKKAGNSTTIDFGAIKAAEAALDDLSEDFDGWMADEIDELAEARDSLLRDGVDDGTRAKLYQAAHNIRGQAATLGHPRAGAAAKSLCILLELNFRPGQTPFALIDSHVSAIKALYMEKDNKTRNALADKLVSALMEMTEDFREKKGLTDAFASG